jgi:hypothetical protein
MDFYGAFRRVDDPAPRGWIKEGQLAAEFTSYQRRVEEWLEACFPPAVRTDLSERTHRFLEEALELAQATGCSHEDAVALVEYVFGRPQGQPEQEAGGVMVTLAGLCSASGVSMGEAANHELEQNWCRIEAIQAKQRA